MRRTLPEALGAGPPGEQREAARWLLDVTLPLECITPVIGGGVDPHTPDATDGVRVPGIRGQLRYFWRALQDPRLSGGDLLSRERGIWGGVGEDRGPSDSGGVKSRVHVSLRVVHRGEDEAAGEHPYKDNKFNALPRWAKKNEGLGYALFPLQREREEMREAQLRGATNLPTRQVRRGVKLDVRVRVARQEPLDDGAGQDPRSLCDQVLGALWCWLCFGGIGARTTRGFGALALREKARIFGLQAEHWSPCFVAPPSSDLAQWLRRGLVKAGARAEQGAVQHNWPMLHGTDIYHGRAMADVGEAHAELIAELQRFRQKPEVGRDRGQGNSHGRSRWPEADMLRSERQSLSGERRLNYEHRPRGEHREAPRAAFGLPIRVQFKQMDREDARASADILPTSRDGSAAGGVARWMSPLRLRPIRCSDRLVVPVALALRRRPGGEVMREVLVKFTDASLKEENRTRSCPVRGSAGAVDPIRKHLAARGGDAVAAFLDWLAGTRGYRKVEPPR